jgi:hypothetical protein
MHALAGRLLIIEMICGWCTDGLQAGTKTAVERTLQAMATTGGGAGFGGDMASVPSLSSAALLSSSLLLLSSAALLLCSALFFSSSSFPVLVSSLNFLDDLFGSFLSKGRIGSEWHRVVAAPMVLMATSMP